MLSFLLSVALCVPADDAAVLFYVASPVEIPQNLTLGPAIERFWEREQIWSEKINWDSDRVRSELLWTRGRWPTKGLPDIAEADRLPTLAEVGQAIQANYWLQSRLEQLAEIAPPWESDNIALQRAEIETCLSVCYSIRLAKEVIPATFCRRQALQELRGMVSDEIWFSGNWPVLYPSHRAPANWTQ